MDPTCTVGDDDEDCDGLHNAEDPDCQGPEVCNGVDDDGDGEIDEGFAQVGDVCSVGLEGSECERFGLYACDLTNGLFCTAQTERPPKPENTPGRGRCTDGKDNDCDGFVDALDTDCQEGPQACELHADFGQPCSIGEGVCLANGNNICTADGAALVCNAVENLAEASPEAPTYGDTCTDGLDNDCDGLADDQDPGCSSANIVARCALEPLQNTANGSSCEGMYRIHYDFGEYVPSPAAVVTAELLALDTAGDVLAVLPVADDEVAHLNSRLDPSDWKWKSKPNKRGGGPLAGPGNYHELFAPVPLLRISVKEPLNEAVAYCAPIPWADVVRPDGTVLDGTNGDELDVLAALPSVQASSLSVTINGIDVFSELGIDPDIFPGTHPGGGIDTDGDFIDDAFFSDIIVDIAPTIDSPSSNTLRMTVEGLGCGGNEVVVNGQGAWPAGTNLDVTTACNVDDIHDCGSVSVFEITIDSPQEGEITSDVPTPVIGKVCHGVEIVQASINRGELPTDSQTFLAPGAGAECSTGTFELEIDALVDQTNLFAEAVGVTELGTFDPGSNLLIASATDAEAHRTFKRFLFGVGDPSLFNLSASAEATLTTNLQSRASDLTWEFSPLQSNEDSLLATATTVVDSFVLNLEGEALDIFFAQACKDATAEASEKFVEAICNLNNTKEFDKGPCCSPDVTVRAICDADAGILPELLVDEDDGLDCSVTAMDGGGPDGTGGVLKVRVGIPAIKFNISAIGDCHGGFLWGCNTDVDLTNVEVIFPHPGTDPDGDPTCSATPICDPIDEPTEDCCIPTQPLNGISLEVDETDFQVGTPEECACEEDDDECRDTCCDPTTPGCIVGSIDASSGVTQARVISGDVSAGGWNIIVLGIIIGAALGLLLGPLAALIGAIVGGFVAGIITAGFDLSGHDVTKDILEEVDLPQLTFAVKDVGLAEKLYEAKGIEISGVELSSVEINSDGVTVSSSYDIDIEVPSPDVDPSLGYFETPAPPPMPPIGGDANAAIALSDDLFNAIFEAQRRQGSISSDGCESTGSLDAGICCPSTDDQGSPRTVANLFPEDCSALAKTGIGVVDARFIGACLGIRAADLSASEGLAFCESFSYTSDPDSDENARATAIGQGVCHGVRGVTAFGCGDTAQVPVPSGPANLLIRKAERDACKNAPQWNIAASDQLLVCARAATEPRFVIADQESTDPVEGMVRLNDLLASIVIDRAADGYNLGELNTLPECTADGTDADCRFIGVCLDLSLEASLLLEVVDAKPQVKFQLGEAIAEEPDGEICEGAVSLSFNADGESADEAAGSDAIEDDLIDNATDSVPIQEPANINLGDLVQFVNPQLGAVSTSADSMVGLCSDDLVTACTMDGDCSGAEARCVIFQDYVTVEGEMAVPPEE